MIDGKALEKLKKEIKKIIEEYSTTNLAGRNHFIEWFGEDSKKTPVECYDRIVKAVEMI